MIAVAITILHTAGGPVILSGWGLLFLILAALLTGD